MMKHYCILTLLVGLLTVQHISAQSVFSPSVNGVRTSYQSHRSASADAQNERIGIVVTCSVEASAATIANQMIELGAVIRVLMGNQLVVDLPLSQLDAAAAIEGVLLIDMPSEGRQRTDTARKASHVDEAHAGKMENQQDLPQAYKGKGVIIGILDSGFDYTHPMFKDAEGNLRIKGVYQPQAVDAKHTGQPDNLNLQGITVYDHLGSATTLNLTGSFYTKPEVILDTTIVKDTDGSHGTQCASIAAGRQLDYTTTFFPKYANSGKLGGMAPDAELVLAEITESEEQKQQLSSVDNMTYYNCMQSLWAMKYFAEKQQKPLVISCSQNNHDGFHDGTSTMARYIAEFCKQNNILALCASNEGGDSMYIARKIGKGKSLKVWGSHNSAGVTNTISFFIRTDKEIQVDLSMTDKNRNVKYQCNLPLTSKSSAENYKKKFHCSVKSDFDPIKNKYVKNVKYDDEYYKDICNKLAEYVTNGDIYVTVNTGSGLDIKNQSFNYVKIELKFEHISLQPDITDFEKSFYPMLTLTSTEADVEIQAWGDYFNLWADSMEQPNVFTPGTAAHSIGDWNTSGQAVTIGAYATDINKLGLDFEGMKELSPSENEELGRYGNFSGYGHDFSEAHRSYPDVSAPGVAIYGAANSFDTSKNEIRTEYSNQFKGQTKPRLYPYSTDSGTSMATPAAAGVIALWVQAAKDKGKTLTNADIKDIIRHTSTTDDFTKANPLRYGAGKINAYKGLLYILDTATAIPELPTRHIGATLNGRTMHIQGNPDTQVTIYNLSGQKMFDAQAQSGIVELPTLPAGVYAVKIGTQGSTLIRL